MKYLLSFLLLNLSLLAIPPYQYIDGNGNKYVIEKELFRYVPIQPAQSSSGFYSGGEPVTKNLNAHQAKALRKLLLEATNLSSEELEATRKMGTGLVILGDEKKIILKMNSEYKKDLESTLKKIRNR